MLVLKVSDLGNPSAHPSFGVHRKVPHQLVAMQGGQKLRWLLPNDASLR